MKTIDEIINRVRNLNLSQQEAVLGILKNWQPEKQREYQRKLAKADIDVVVGDKVIQTDTRDISASGIYINTSGKFETNKSVRIVFSIPGYDKPFKLKGIIIRVEEDGLAIQFEDVTPYFKKILDDVLWENENKGNDS
ncbi:MAG: PilZ domain-containing protein [Desulfobacteraceae bacterium]|nr:PilZ domain-containing protein [Desulfobacteraceae bacterium]